MIRAMKAQDLDAVKKINETTIPENYPMWFWEGQFMIGKEHSFVVEESGQILGYILCSLDTIVSFAILPLARRRGLGKKLLARALKTFTGPVRLQVRKSNQVAMRMYMLAGFVVERELFNVYSNPRENGYEMVLLSNEKYI